jgi:2-methylaconitate cis-trans-isomerase PrpF
MEILGIQELVEEKVDLVARAISVGQPHHTIALTAALYYAVAAGVKGSWPKQGWGRVVDDRASHFRYPVKFTERWNGQHK